MEKKKKIIWLNLLIYIYLFLPVLIFVVGWLKWYWALPFGILMALACVKGFTDSVQCDCFLLEKSDFRILIKALFLIILWVYLSGIGGWCYQNSDHEARSAIFRALVEYDWPVVSYDGSRGLIYYIGFWLPAACFGKVFGLEAGYTVQVIWAVLGIFIVYYLICVFRKKVELWPLVFMIFFSGLDYVGAWILGEAGTDLKIAQHLEWWAVDFQFTSMTAQLYWVFNQAIPAWVATIVIMTQKNCRNMLFVLSLMMLSSTIPFVGLIPIVVYLYIKRIREGRECWREIITFQNIVGVFIIGGCTFLYLIGNVSGQMINKDNAELVIIEPMAGLLRYMLFFFLEFGIYLCFVLQYRKKDFLVYLLIIVLVLCPFIKVGGGHDFCMRASVPALFILMLMGMEAWESIRQSGRKYLLVGYCVVLLLGGKTAFNEMHRSVRETYWRVSNGESVKYPEISIENQLLQFGNFSGEISGNWFFQYLANTHKYNTD